MNTALLDGFYFFVSTPWGQWGLVISGLLLTFLISTRLWVWFQLYKPILQSFESSKNLTALKCVSLKKISYIGFLIFAGLFGFLLGDVLGLLAGCIVAGVGLFVFLSHQKSQQNGRISQQLPLFLRALGSTLKAGYSVPQALVFVAGEVEDPLKHKLQRGVRLLEWQQPLEHVLNDWKKEVSIPEFSFLTRSLILQAKTGGNLVDLCHRVAHLLEERQKLERDIRSFTAQGKMSGILMAGLWPISLALFAWLSPSHTQVLFSTLPGQILLGLSLSLELIGFYFIWRLVRLKI